MLFRSRDYLKNVNLSAYRRLQGRRCASRSQFYSLRCTRLSVHKISKSSPNQSNSSCVDETEKYLRGKLSKYTKDEIVNAIIRHLDYVEIDRLVNVCWQLRALKEREEQEQREMRQKSEMSKLKGYIDEYNKLVAEAREKGLTGMPTEKIERMSALITKIRRLTKV